MPRRDVAYALCVALGFGDALWKQARDHFYPPVDTKPAKHTLGSWLRAHLDNANMTQTELVLILTPVKNATPFLESYFRLLNQLKQSLNPLSRYDFGRLASLHHAREWQAK